ncbi:MAG: macro domain-containing protein [Lachnospiraceae bacterium]|nr:macro domain-containing protein [Lachnospiraceae bacterium]
MNTIDIRKTGITELETDAIVNAANEFLQAGGGVCGAIFREAGFKELTKACDSIGRCDTGSAVITPGFNLKAKYIIHAVGPRWVDGRHHEAKLLFGAYYRSLELAVKNGCRSIAFPLISSGIFGYPVSLAWDQALEASKTFLDRHPKNGPDIVFAVIDDEVFEIGRKKLKARDFSEYRVAGKKDWGIAEMPAKRANFVLERTFTEEEMSSLRRGHIPEAMEDKWFYYMEGDTLSIHRSWSGFCIYRVEFRDDGRHVVTANQDPEQYTGDLEDSIETLDRLLEAWSKR